MELPKKHIGGRQFFRRRINGIAWAERTEDGHRAGIIGVELYDADQTGNHNAAAIISKKVYLGVAGSSNKDKSESERDYYDALTIINSKESIELTKEKAKIILDMLS
uniref:Uncharacterized protein n=1 Tax=Siphoviridae sp. ct1SN28 TaxID=2825308 RepID=A0A8S5TRL8_9CAUD|nr:MAG TPA: hypothetical protein [Siphoviridae sp. ct1SN28]